MASVTFNMISVANVLMFWDKRRESVHSMANCLKHQFEIDCVIQGWTKF